MSSNSHSRFFSQAQQLSVAEEEGNGLVSSSCVEGVVRTYVSTGSENIRESKRAGLPKLLEQLEAYLVAHGTEEPSRRPKREKHQQQQRRKDGGIEEEYITFTVTAANKNIRDSWTELLLQCGVDTLTPTVAAAAKPTTASQENEDCEAEAKGGKTTTTTTGEADASSKKESDNNNKKEADESQEEEDDSVSTTTFGLPIHRAATIHRAMSTGGIINVIVAIVAVLSGQQQQQQHAATKGGKKGSVSQKKKTTTGEASTCAAVNLPKELTLTHERVEHDLYVFGRNKPFRSVLSAFQDLLPPSTSSTDSTTTTKQQQQPEDDDVMFAIFHAYHALVMYNMKAYWSLMATSTKPLVANSNSINATTVADEEETEGVVSHTDTTADTATDGTTNKTSSSTTKKKKNASFIIPSLQQLENGLSLLRRFLLVKDYGVSISGHPGFRHIAVTLVRNPKKTHLVLPMGARCPPGTSPTDVFNQAVENPSPLNLARALNIIHPQNSTGYRQRLGILHAAKRSGIIEVMSDLLYREMTGSSVIDLCLQICSVFALGLSELYQAPEFDGEILEFIVRYYLKRPDSWSVLCHLPIATLTADPKHAIAIIRTAMRTISQAGKDDCTHYDMSLIHGCLSTLQHFVDARELDVNQWTELEGMMEAIMALALGHCGVASSKIQGWNRVATGIEVSAMNIIVMIVHRRVTQEQMRRKEGSKSNKNNKKKKMNNEDGEGYSTELFPPQFFNQVLTIVFTSQHPTTVACACEILQGAFGTAVNHLADKDFDNLIRAIEKRFLHDGALGMHLSASDGANIAALLVKTCVVLKKERAGSVLLSLASEDTTVWAMPMLFAFDVFLDPKKKKKEEEGNTNDEYVFPVGFGVSAAPILVKVLENSDGSAILSVLSSMSSLLSVSTDIQHALLSAGALELCVGWLAQPPTSWSTDENGAEVKDAQQIRIRHHTILRSTLECCKKLSKSMNSTTNTLRDPSKIVKSLMNATQHFSQKDDPATTGMILQTACNLAESSVVSKEHFQASFSSDTFLPKALKSTCGPSAENKQKVVRLGLALGFSQGDFADKKTAAGAKQQNTKGDAKTTSGKNDNIFQKLSADKQQAPTTTASATKATIGFSLISVNSQQKKFRTMRNNWESGGGGFQVVSSNTISRVNHVQRKERETTERQKKEFQSMHAPSSSSTAARKRGPRDEPIRKEDAQHHDPSLTAVNKSHHNRKGEDQRSVPTADEEEGPSVTVEDGFKVVRTAIGATIKQRLPPTSAEEELKRKRSQGPSGGSNTAAATSTRSLTVHGDVDVGVDLGVLDARLKGKRKDSEAAKNRKKTSATDSTNAKKGGQQQQGGAASSSWASVATHAKSREERQREWEAEEELRLLEEKREQEKWEKIERERAEEKKKRAAEKKQKELIERQQKREEEERRQQQLRAFNAGGGRSGLVPVGMEADDVADVLKKLLPTTSNVSIHGNAATAGQHQHPRSQPGGIQMPSSIDDTHHHNSRSSSFPTQQHQTTTSKTANTTTNNNQQQRNTTNSSATLASLATRAPPQQQQQRQQQPQEEEVQGLNIQEKLRLSLEQSMRDAKLRLDSTTTGGESHHHSVAATTTPANDERTVQQSPALGVTNNNPADNTYGVNSLSSYTNTAPMTHQQQQQQHQQQHHNANNHHSSTATAALAYQQQLQQQQQQSQPQQFTFRNAVANAPATMQPQQHQHNASAFYPPTGNSSIQPTSSSMYNSGTTGAIGGGGASSSPQHPFGGHHHHHHQQHQAFFGGMMPSPPPPQQQQHGNAASNNFTQQQQQQQWLLFHHQQHQFQQQQQQQRTGIPNFSTQQQQQQPPLGGGRAAVGSGSSNSQPVNPYAM